MLQLKMSDFGEDYLDFGAYRAPDSNDEYLPLIEKGHSRDNL